MDFLSYWFPRLLFGVATQPMLTPDGGVVSFHLHGIEIGPAFIGLSRIYELEQDA